MDRSVENIHLLMVKDNLEFKEIELLEGYKFVAYSSGLKDKWVDIQVESGHILEREEGENYFEDVFLKKEKLLEELMIFIESPNGEIVGTGAIWEGKHFQNDKKREYRLHWIAIDPKHGGKGLAKALVSKLLSIFKDKKMGEGLYLSTQTCSYVAIKIYQNFGFQPYNLKEDSVGWSIVFQKLNER